MAVHASWRLFAWIGAAVLGFAVIGTFVTFLTEGGLGLLDDPEDAASYFAVFALVYGDAVIAIMPGETTLNTASVLASDGELELALVIAAGFLGAWLGDNTLYWIARSVHGLRDRVEKAQEDERFRKALDMVGRNSALLVAICRFLPYVRWGVMASMGALPMPYGRFLLWSGVGAFAWSTYTCLMAYTIGTALDDYPIASVVIACLISGVILGIGYFIWKRIREGRGETESASQEASP